MTSLLATPRMEAQAFATTERATRLLRMGVTPATRARAAHQLSRAVRAGHIEPAAAMTAIGLGDDAVARLLRPLTPDLPLPNVPARALDCLPTRKHLSGDRLANVLAIARELARSGDLPAQDLMTLAAGKPNTMQLTVVIQQAWQRRVDRLTAIIVPRHRFKPDTMPAGFSANS
jgi:hypothetical protein